MTAESRSLQQLIIRLAAGQLEHDVVLAIPHEHIPRRLVHPDAVRPRHRPRLEAADAFLRRGCELSGRDSAHPVDGAGCQVDATDRV